MGNLEQFINQVKSTQNDQGKINLQNAVKNYSTNPNFNPNDLNNSTNGFTDTQGGALNPQTANDSPIIPLPSNSSTLANLKNSGSANDITYRPPDSTQWNPGSIPWNSVSQLANPNQPPNPSPDSQFNTPIDYSRMLVYGGLGGLLGGGPIPYAVKFIDKQITAKIPNDTKFSHYYNDVKTKWQNLSTKNTPHTVQTPNYSVDQGGDINTDFADYSEKFVKNLHPEINGEDSFFAFSHYLNNSVANKLDNLINSPKLIKPNEFISDHSDIFGVNSVPELAGEFVKGAAIAGLAVSANDYVDRLFTQQNHHDANWLFNGLFLPVALSAPNMASVVTYGLGGSIASLAINAILPKGNGETQYSQFLKPTPFSSLLMGASMLMPAETTAARMTYILGAWTLGNVNHLIFDKPD